MCADTVHNKYGGCSLSCAGRTIVLLDGIDILQTDSLVACHGPDPHVKGVGIAGL